MTCIIEDALQNVAWLPTDAVSGAILDVALGEDEPPIVINIVHPRPVEWEALMKPISDALFAKNVTREPLPLVPSAEWYQRLEKHAVNANEAKIKRVVGPEDLFLGLPLTWTIFCALNATCITQACNKATELLEFFRARRSAFGRHEPGTGRRCESVGFRIFHRNRRESK